MSPFQPGVGMRWQRRRPRGDMTMQSPLAANDIPTMRTRRARAMLAGRSPLMLRFFGLLFERDLASSFHAVRYAGTLPTTPGPMVIYANHPSWWDGELFVWLSARVFTQRRTFAPIESAMLKQYPFFGRIGAFGVTPGYAGASSFLAVGEAVLDLEDGLLLVNAEGRFRDPRDRPLGLAPGLVHLARRLPGARYVPLAIEYAFWDERRPNLLLRFGDAVPGAALEQDASAGPALRDALSATMDALAADAATRDPRRFATLLAGRTRINPFYDAWRGAKALVRGQRFDPSHSAAPERKPR